MNNKSILVDLFCKAGGATRGYQMAGFYVIGVDHETQPRYVGDDFYQMDALEFVRTYDGHVDAWAASPPCQAYSVTRSLHNNEHPDLVGVTRELLLQTGKPYVIENVPGAPLQNPLLLCGTMFGLLVIRHRLFECRPPIWFPPAACCHWGKTAPTYNCTIEQTEQYDFICVAGNFAGVDIARKAMNIDWMTRAELSQAIPPAYTEFIGKHLLRHLETEREVAA